MKGRLAPIALLVSLVLCVGQIASCGPIDPSRRGPFFRSVDGSGIMAVNRPREGDTTLMDRMDGGVCLLDVDGAAPLDVFFPSRVDGASTLYVGDAAALGTGALRWTDATASSGLTAVGDAVGCLAFDAEGDGDDDLLVTGVANLRLYLQEGNTFVARPDLLSVTVPANHALVSSAAGDVDGDGDLDLVVAGYIDVSMMTTPPDPGVCRYIPCSLLVALFVGVPSYLLINQGGVFTDRTREIAPDLALPEPTLVVGIADLDGNGTQDILVGNDTPAVNDRFLVRSGSVFTDMAMARGLATDGQGHGVESMGIAIADVDGDGLLDVTHTAFAGEHTPVWICGADELCVDQGRALGTSANSDAVRWSNALFDVDLDGDLDLLEVAGHVFKDSDVSEMLMNDEAFAHADRPRLLLGDEGAFVTSSSSDALVRTWAARGMGLGDLDDDGRLDVVIGVTDGTPAVLRNVTTGGVPLTVVLRGAGANSRGIGARVEASTGGVTQVRIVRAGEGYASTYDPRPHFGFAAPGLVDVTVRWASGAVTTVIGIDTALTPSVCIDEASGALCS
jgi:enediyne biosynthesis protein E4